MKIDGALGCLGRKIGSFFPDMQCHFRLPPFCFWLPVNYVFSTSDLSQLARANAGTF
jgi:hypothetical protein